MTLSIKSAPGLLSLFLFGPVLYATAQDAGVYTLEVNTQAVVLDVLVTDKHGHPVQGLHRDDFSIKEDRVPQEIRYFESATERPASPAVHSTAELDKLAPDAPVTLLVLDELNGSAADENYSRQALRHYLDAENETLPMPTMLLAVNLHGVMMLADYTTSRKDLQEVLARHAPPHDALAQNPNWKDQEFSASMHALEGVAQATSGHRGHKNVLWIGKGCPAMSADALNSSYRTTVETTEERAVNALRNARITLYSLDPESMTPGPDRQTYDMEGGGLTSGVGMPSTEVLSGSLDFRRMVSFTGGKSFADGNNLDKLIAEGVRDGESFYTLTYRPSAKRDGQQLFHSIKIIMKDPNLHAVTREGYFSRTGPEASVLDTKGRISQPALLQIGTAARGLMIYDAVPFTISRDPSAADNFVLHLKGAKLAWNPASDGKQTSDIAVVIVGFDVNGREVSQTGQMATVSLPVLENSGPETRMVNLAVTTSTAAPTARLRFILRTVDGKLGADNFFLVDKRQLHDSAVGLKPVRR
jgi:VWFA-related protein